jgi:hypothetical protein
MQFPEHRPGQFLGLCSIWSYGGHSVGETPGPIPNPEVKPYSADGTAWETVWESRTPPDIFNEQPPPSRGRLFVFMRVLNPGWGVWFWGFF